MTCDTLVIGVGNPDRGDDGAGVEVVRQLVGRVPDEVVAVELGGDVTRLLPLVQSARRVILVDAMRSGAAPGTVRRFDARETPLPAPAFRGASTHGVDVAAAIELGRVLRQLPEALEVVGIEGACFEAGSTLSPAVGDAIGRVVDTLNHEGWATKARGTGHEDTKARSIRP